jgi:glycosyltransferase involved in cell wall biosynthesis
MLSLYFTARLLTKNLTLMSLPVLSVVSPVYQAASLVAELVQRVVASATAVGEEFELILVDDRSNDGSWAAIQFECARDPRVRGLRLSRNFGQHCAITAGLAQCRGRWVVVLDCDLQDPPEAIPALWNQARQQGHDLVLARRAQRQDSWLQRQLSRAFNRGLAYLSDTVQDAAVGNFGLYHRKVVDAVLALPESIRYFPTMVRWVGFQAGTLDVAHGRRLAGSSSYSFRRRLHLATDVLLANSDKPLRLTVKLGLSVSGLAFLMALVTLVRFLRGSIIVPGYASLIISVWFFSGLLLTVLGVMGLYLGKTFEQVKNRPLYIVDQTTAPPPAA